MMNSTNRIRATVNIVSGRRGYNGSPEGLTTCYARKIPPKEGFYDVVMHGAPTYAEFFGEPIDAYTLANIIRNREDYPKGSMVRLLSCSTGNIESTGDCFAQLLANELGVKVEAPTMTIYINSNGSFKVGEKIAGEMKLFYPRK